MMQLLDRQFVLHNEVDYELFYPSKTQLAMRSRSGPNDKKPPPSGHEELKGKIGVSITNLASSGKVQVDGTIIEAISSDGFVPQGSRVRILGRKMSYWMVQVCL